MSTLHPELKALILSGPMAHLSTTNADGSPQVSVIWIGLDGEFPVPRGPGRLLRYKVIKIGGVGPWAAK